MMLKLLKRLLKDLSVSLVGILLLIACGLVIAGLVLFGYSRLPGKTHAVVSSLGKYADRVFYTSGGFQDFTDYAKYHYPSIDTKRLENSVYFQQVGEGSPDALHAYIQNFEGWIGIHAGSDLAVHYDFDKACIGPEDFFYLQAENGFDSYNLYFLDFQENTLYYFHNNI